MGTVVGQILADSNGWGHMSGWGWGWMALGWLFWITIIALVVFAVTRLSDGKPRKSGAEELLSERFARGELSVEEFEAQRDALRR